MVNKDKGQSLNFFRSWLLLIYKKDMNLNHSVHDYRKLISHWRHLPKQTLRLKSSLFITILIYEISNGLLDQGLPSLYLSAGITEMSQLRGLSWAENAYALKRYQSLSSHA